MQYEKGKKLLRVLGGIMALVSLVLAGLVLYGLINGYFSGNNPEPKAMPASQEELTMRDDLMPDMDSFFNVWDLTYVQTDGKKVALSGFRGKPLVLVYWNSWCPDCKKAIANVDQAAQIAEGMGGELVLVAREGVRDETAQSASMYLASRGIRQKTLLDPDAAEYERLGLHWVPTILYFDENGVLMFADTEGDLSSEAVRAGLEYAQKGGRAATATFLQDQLIDAQGRVAASFTVHEDGQINRGNVALSEAQGLVMRYALDIGDQSLFDLAYGYVRNSMSRGDLAAWRQDGQTLAETNATLDDLRIAAALYDAQASWGGYDVELKARTDAIAARLVENGYLVDYTHFDSGQNASTMTLCYGDLQALGKLASVNTAFSAVRDNARALAVDGRISDAFPLCYPRYQLDIAQYEGEEIHTAEAMLTLLHLAQDGSLRTETLAFLIDWVRSGPIYARYSILGEALADYVYESTATYAIMVIIGCEMNNEALIRAALYRMEHFRVLGNSKANGAYAYKGENFAFDTLYALLAWQTLEDHGFLSRLQNP